MKKFLSTLLALVLILSLPVTALAASTNTTVDQNHTGAIPPTTVQYSVPPAYTITIPGTVTLNKDTSTGKYKQNATISAAAGVRLLRNQTIKVTMASDFKLSAGTATWDYTVKVGTTTITSTNNVVATFTTNANAQTSTLHFEAENPAYAGEYTDTVTFTIALDPQPTTP